MTTFLKHHWAALFCAVAVSALIGGSLWYGAHQVPGFAGHYKEFADDQIYYLARARDIIDGHTNLANPYLAEHKEGLPLQIWLPDYLLAKPLGLLGIPVSEGYIYYVGLFAGIVLFLTYCIVFEVTRSRFFALATALFLHLGIFANAQIRIPSPLFDFIFFNLVFLSVLLYLRTDKKIYIGGATLSFGLLFYLYPYYWTFWAVTLALTGASYFFFLSGDKYKKIAAVLVGGFAIGSHYLYTTWLASKQPFYEETLQRLGLIHSHFPSGYQVVVWGIVTLVVLTLAWRRGLVKVDATSLLLLSGTLGSIIVMNQHVITGSNLEFSAHYFVPCMSWFVITLIYCAVHCVGSIPHATKRSYAMAGIVLLLLAISYGNVAYGNMAGVLRAALTPTERDIYEQRYVPVFAWLSANSKKDDVVFANERLSELIPVYTSLNIYYSAYAELFFMPNTEVYERYIINNFWDTYTDEYLLAHEHNIFGAGYIDAALHAKSENMLRDLMHMPLAATELLPESVRQSFLAQARAMQQQGFESQLRRYRADYLVWDTATDPDWHVERYPFLEKQFAFQGVFVYKIKAPKPSSSFKTESR